MSDPLSALVDQRSALLHQVSQLGDFQPGSISSPRRKCGKPTCHCAKPDDPGHEPHFQLTQKVDGRTVTQSLMSQTFPEFISYAWGTARRCPTQLSDKTCAFGATAWLV
jgi:hypothetical protein